jgi:hypothetical protein
MFCLMPLARSQKPARATQMAWKEKVVVDLLSRWG